MRFILPPRVVALACLTAIVPVTAQAQADSQDATTLRRFSAGGEFSATIAPSDAGAYFNYTDYDQYLLRQARMRLFGEWRIADGLQIEGELRVDNGGAEVAAWYLRWRPRRDWPLDVQLGRIPPVIGAFARRAYGRDNPVMGAPLAYQYLTSLRHDAAPETVDDLLRMRARGWRPSFPVGSSEPGPGVALVSSTSWDTGVEARWRHGRVELAGAVTRGAPSVPVVSDSTAGLQWSGRALVALPGGAILGVSGARGTWLDRDVVRLLPEVTGRRGTQSIHGVDLEYGHGAWLVRAEWLRSNHDLPLVSPAGSGLALSAHSGFTEVRWRPLTRWQVAVRAGYLRFGRVKGQAFADGPWDAPVERLEGAVTYRVTRQLDLRAGWQENWRDGGRVRRRGFPVASVLYWF